VLTVAQEQAGTGEEAQAVRDLLRPHMNVFYDDAGVLAAATRRQDEAGGRRSV
jgi:hypothetical protein